MRLHSLERRSLRLCKDLIARYKKNVNAGKGRLLKDAVELASNPTLHRERSLQRFRRRFEESSNGDGNHPLLLDHIPRLDQSSLHQFQQNHLVANVPCLIEDARPYFDPVVSLWTDADGGDIRREWFHDAIPHDAWLSVTKSDDTEIRLKLQDWFSYLDGNLPQHQQPSMLYLKDWHFLHWMYENTDRPEFGHSNPLYQVPPHFEDDILNNFHMVQSGDMSDYRFVYWGPAGSTTQPHTDVLHSCSWSYNVSGTKEWVIHVPLDDHSSNAAPSLITIKQQAGQIIFIPSGWQHSVVNLEETLSVNHNWATAAHVDCIWNCVREDLHKLQLNEPSSRRPTVEHEEWGLRQSNGLSVNVFFFMVLLRGWEVLLAGLGTESTPAYDWNQSFELHMLKNALTVLLDDESIRLHERLDAFLATDEDAFSDHDKENMQNGQELATIISAARALVSVIEHLPVEEESIDFTFSHLRDKQQPKPVR